MKTTHSWWKPDPELDQLYASCTKAGSGWSNEYHCRTYEEDFWIIKFPKAFGWSLHDEKENCKKWIRMYENYP